jgi:hypothetical protein
MHYAALRSPTASTSAESVADEGVLVMKTRLIVFVIGIVTAILGCATKEVADGQSLHVRVATYSAPVGVWYGRFGGATFRNTNWNAREA